MKRRLVFCRELEQEISAVCDLGGNPVKVGGRAGIFTGKKWGVAPEKARLAGSSRIIFLATAMLQPVQYLVFGLTNYREVLSCPHTNEAAGPTGFHQAQQMLVGKSWLAVPVGVKFAQEVALIGSRFGLPNQTDGIGQQGSDHPGRHLRFYDPNIIQQTKDAILLDVRPLQERRAVNEHELGKGKREPRVDINMQLPFLCGGLKAKNPAGYERPR